MSEPRCPEEVYENCGWKTEAERLRTWQAAYAKGRAGLVEQADQDFARANAAEAEVERLRSDPHHMEWQEAWERQQQRADDLQVKLGQMTSNRDAWRREAVMLREHKASLYRLLFLPPLVGVVNKLLAKEQKR